MNKKHERKTLKLKEMNFREFVDKNPVKTHDIIKTNKRSQEIKGFFKKIAYIFLGVGKKENTTSSTVPQRSIPTNSASNWRKEQSLEEYYWERMQRESYLDLVDGKGDHEHCDHDER